MSCRRRLTPPSAGTPREIAARHARMLWWLADVELTPRRPASAMCAPPHGLPGISAEFECAGEGRCQIGRLERGHVHYRLVLGLGQRHRAGARRGSRPAGLARRRSSAPAAIDQQAVEGIGNRVQGRSHDRELAERLPLGRGLEADLEGNAPAIGVPGPIECAVRQRCLDQFGVIRVLPMKGGGIPMQDLDRPPFSH